jgi:flagellar protein FlgJ
LSLPEHAGIREVKLNQQNKLRGAVGARSIGTAGATTSAGNDPVDVRLVQGLLNRSLHDVPNFHSLAEDGVCGLRTQAAITEFQRRFVPGVRADGRVDPGGHTIAALIAKAGQPVPHVNAFLSANGKSAKAAAAAWNVPASVLIAQAAHESAWGRHVKGNAYFGIKGKSSQGQSTSFKTHEVVGNKSVAITDTFRAYKDFAEAADDYGRFLNGNPRYRGCFSYSKDPIKFVETLAAAGYATDPDYARKIKNIIRKYGLTDYDK